MSLGKLDNIGDSEQIFGEINMNWEDIKEEKIAPLYQKLDGALEDKIRKLYMRYRELDVKDKRGGAMLVVAARMEFALGEMRKFNALKEKMDEDYEKVMGD